MGQIVLESLIKVLANDGVAVGPTIGDGELMILVGPSGCGKTSLLRNLLGPVAAAA